jgi:hypothetical protein
MAFAHAAAAAARPVNPSACDVQAIRACAGSTSLPTPETVSVQLRVSFGDHAYLMIRRGLCIGWTEG